jgi:3-deoxy-D-manno-octulosonic-acid transferase
MLPIYTLLIYIAAPLVAATKALRRGGLAKGELRDRWGFVDARFASAPLWIHAVSVGEVQAAAVLVRALQKKYPDRPLLVTTGTQTGAQRVRALFGDSVQHAYLPYDMPGAVRRFLERVRPTAGIVLETEIWPNMFRECRRRRIPLLLASARLSEKSVRRYTRLRGLARQALREVSIAAQTATDAQRFVAIGADPARVEVIGNVKFDIHVSDELRANGRAVRLAQFADRPAWIAASTHEGEEQIALDAHDQILRRLSGALLVLVPRHPQRFAAVKAMLESRRIAYVSRSLEQPVSENTNVLLVDTLGELLMFYAAVDVAFVGGSLVPIGGHNLLEPAALALPILTGPHIFNAPDIAQLLFSQQAALQVDSQNALADRVEWLLINAGEREALGARAKLIVEQNRGALDRLLTRIAERIALSG